MIRAVIFDFDGLIVDTESPILQAWSEVYSEHGCAFPVEDWSAGIGNGTSNDALDMLETMLGHPLDRAAVDARRRERQALLVESQPILPGVMRCITDAREMGLRLGGASSSSRRWVTGQLERLGLIHHFDAIRTRTDPDVGVQKPDPTVYLAALSALGVGANEAIALEDSRIGVLAATTAGIFTVGVPNDVTRATGVHGADLSLESLADMSLNEIVRVANAKSTTQETRRSE